LHKAAAHPKSKLRSSCDKDGMGLMGFALEYCREIELTLSNNNSAFE
jgi:hypothetical protein